MKEKEKKRRRKWKHVRKKIDILNLQNIQYK